MFDLHSDPTSIALIEGFANAGKPISAVCHGPTVLIKAKASTGEPLLAPATVTAFSDVEEDQVGFTQSMPFSLEGELKKVTGGKYVKAEQPWAEKVVVSKGAGNGVTIITGQNPNSTYGVGNAILNALGL